MASVEEFLADHPAVAEGAAPSTTSTSQVRLAVVLTGISEQAVKFTYYNTAYVVARDAVLDIESAADGQTVSLSIARGASVQAIQDVSAEDLDHAVPFGLSRPLTGFVRPPSTERDLAWRRSQEGAALYDVPTIQEVLAQYATTSYSYGDTASNGMADDSGPNDSITDYV